MTDDFLYRLRKDPPPAFAARLKQKIERQPKPKRFAVVYSVVLGFVIGASAFAATWWAVQSGRTDRAESAVAQRFDSRDATSPSSSTVSLEQQRSSAEVTSFDDAERSERAHAERNSTSMDLASAPAEKASAGAPATIGAIGGFSSATHTSSGESSRTSRRFPIRIAGSENGISIAEHLARRFGDALFAIEAERVDAAEAFRRLCEALGERSADIIITTRTITPSELQLCGPSRLKGAVLETKLGYIGVAISGANTAPSERFSPRDIYLALAKRVPDPANPDRFIPNPYVSWRQFDASYQERRITIFGPERSSPLARAFAATILQAGCESFPSIQALSERDPAEYRRLCREIREDQVYTPVYEGEFFLTQTLWGDPNALAILSIGFVEIHRAELIGSLLTGSLPTQEAIRSGSYEGARPLYLYTRRHALRDRDGLQWFVDELVSDRAIGPTGYLVDQALVPLDAAERAERSQSLRELDDPVR